MKPVYQTRLGEVGNCMMAGLASVAEYEGNVDDLPDLGEIEEAGGDWWGTFCRTAADLGFIVWHGASTKVADAADARPEGYHLASGPGTHPGAHPLGHVAVYKDGVLVHDPHPEGSGVDPIDGWYLLIPLAA